MRNYREKLKDPRWQKKRLQIMERDEFSCQSCGETESMLSIHHRYYEKGKDPWDYPDEALITLCELCHEEERSGRKIYEEEIINLLKRNFLHNQLGEILAVLEGLPTKDHKWFSKSDFLELLGMTLKFKSAQEVIVLLGDICRDRFDEDCWEHFREKVINHYNSREWVVDESKRKISRNP